MTNEKNSVESLQNVLKSYKEENLDCNVESLEERTQSFGDKYVLICKEIIDG